MWKHWAPRLLFLIDPPLPLPAPLLDRRSISAFETYTYDPRPGDDDCPPISCPLVCLGGEEDSSTSQSELDHWASFTTGDFRLKMFDGGHFFLQGKGEPVVLEFLSDVLAPLY